MEPRKGHGIMRYLAFWRNHTNGKVIAEEEQCETPDKENCKHVPEERCEQKAVEKIDEQIDLIKEVDSKRHDDVTKAFDLTSLKMRCHILSVKRKNGGLTSTEERELLSLRGTI